MVCVREDHTGAEEAITSLVSISAVLRLLRSNEQESGFKLPGARLTVPEGHPDFARFLAEAAAYRKASEMRLRAKAKTSKNARATLRETREPA
jgi:hypothetical protein